MPAKRIKKKDELDLLFEETPIGPIKQKSKSIKVTTSLDGISSLTIMRELLKRHATDLMVAGFWIELALIIWWKLG